MNAERLLANYERIADASNAIPRVRRFLLDLAVRGKLVLQNGSETPAKPYSDEPVLADLPLNWRVLNFGKFCDIEGGNQPPKSQFVGEPKEGYVRLLQIRDLGERPVPTFIPIGSTNRFCKKGEILIGRYGASLGKIFWAQDGAYNVALAKFIWPDDALIGPFAFLLLKSEYFQGHLAGATRSAQAGFNKGDLTAINFPLPAIPEQHRIVAKFDELMTLCDRLEARRAEREATRDRLTAVSLGRLNVPNPNTFDDDARFALDAFPALTARTDQIKQLRQTILNLAVRGKLVPQDPTDEPASKLLKRITSEKAESGRPQKRLLDFKVDELANLPKNWSAIPLIALGQWAIGAGFPKNEQGKSEGPYFFLKVSDMNLPGNEKYITTANNCIGEAAAKRMRAAIHPPGTIIFPKIGGAIATNKRRILARGSAIDNNCLGITLSRHVDLEWAYLLLTTLDFTRYQAGTAVPALQQGVLESIPVWLPPVAEQHRIVAKVNELIAGCDRLEASVTTADETRYRLLEALLAEVVMPNEERGLEAAE